MTSARIWLIRHGETAWSLEGKHTGRTDVPLTDQGRAQAEAVRDQLRRAIGGASGLVRPGLVLCSPSARAQETARLAGLSPDECTDDLLEWDYGAWEGRTTADIRAELGDPSWLIWEHPIPAGQTPGEQLDDVARRVERVIGRCQPVLDEGRDCVLVAHGHVLRILTARWLALPPIAGRLFALDPACLSSLGHEHETRVIRSWNARTT